MSNQGRMSKSMSKILAAALLTGGLSATILVMAPQLRAQTPTVPAAPAPAATPPAAAPAPAQAAKPAAPPPGMMSTGEVPFYADWAGSKHADAKTEPFRHWDKEGVIPAECAQCHSTPGFRDYIGADGSTPFKVDRPVPVGTVITCTACHNSKASSLATVVFPSGAKVEHLDANARCMTCHQGRESTVSVNKAIAGAPDDQVMPKLAFINVHYFAAGATLYGHIAKGGYEYPGKAYAGLLKHRAPYTTCTSCHATHALEVKVSDCAACHKEVTNKASLHKIRTDKVDLDGSGDANKGVAEEIDNLRGKLFATIQDYAKNVAKKPVVYSGANYPYFFVDTNGNGQPDGKEAIFPNRYQNWTPRMMKAAYNYQFVTKDPGAYAHNPAYTAQLLHDSLADLGTRVTVDLKKATRP
jgi:hypothetical protein